MSKTNTQAKLVGLAGGKENAETKLDTIYDSRKTVRVVDSLYNCIDLKDPKLARHCQAVASYSVRIASALGYKQKELKKLSDAALLHDVGKIMVDTVILNKQGQLTDREFLQIRGHSERGMRILAGFRVGDLATDVAWHHHERWDGQGYPDGLKTEEINRLTRIVSVADSIDAMAENRPYRNHLNDEEIITQLTVGSGKQFDPEIAEAAIKLIRLGKLVASPPDLP